MPKEIKKSFTDFTKEEQWLDEMSNDGYALVRYRGGRYIFEEAQPGYYQYAIELLGEGNKDRNEEYLSFLKEMGIEIVATYAGRVYLRKKSDGNDFMLHSDIDERIKQYQKGHAIWAAISSSQFAVGASLLFYGMQYVPQESAIRYIVLVFSGLLFLSSVLLVGVLGRPYRKKIRLLKSEKEIRE